MRFAFARPWRERVRVARGGEDLLRIVAVAGAAPRVLAYSEYRTASAGGSFDARHAGTTVTSSTAP